MSFIDILRYVLEHKAPCSNPLYDLITITGKYIGLSMMDLKNGTNLSRYLSYIQIVNNMISAIPDDRGVGGMTYFKSLLVVVERRRQNDKACKDLFLKIYSCDLPMM
ncbi:hypothetical protein H8356DRAFT_1420252 [Neocallimastix lanati (nom. inval.)]|nr:hypothetical protein H8356DRAFT_1420252 [Neocallimastix sp. JGI-2020a]